MYKHKYHPVFMISFIIDGTEMSIPLVTTEQFKQFCERLEEGGAEYKVDTGFIELD